MNEAVMLWALWTIGGGNVYYGHLATAPAPVAYFATAKECESVLKLLEGNHRWARCIGANYLLPRGTK